MTKLNIIDDVEKDLKVLNRGIDSLYLSYGGPIKKEILVDLQYRKMAAQSADLRMQALAVMVIGDDRFEVHDKGECYYRYVIENAWCRVSIGGDSQARKVPQVYVQIRSTPLQYNGVWPMVDYVRTIVSHLLVSIQSETVSRADIFADFTTDFNFDTVKRESWITRACRKDNMSMHNAFTGWQLGIGGALAARLYNKSMEIKKSNKDYMNDIWKDNGWDGCKEVLRLEFQSRREVLGQMSISSVNDLMKMLNDLWRYCTQDWLRLAINDGTKNKSRWKTDRIWEQLQNVRFNDGTFTGITRYIDKSRVPSDDSLFKLGAGVLSSYAASRGIDDIETAYPKFIKEIVGFLNENKGNDKEYFETQIALKMKRYNTGCLVL